MIPVNSIRFGGNEKKYLAQCIDDGWVSSEGPFVRKLESSFAAYHDMQHGIAVSNGTAALELALKSLNVNAEDEVILPTFTIMSCALAVIRSGAKPVFVDCDSRTWNMSPTDVLSKINSKTKAIMCVHIYGLPVDMQRILEVAQEKGIKIIEDCAELLGQRYFNKTVGSFGDISIFSFYANKHVTSGEGGMIVCNDTQIADQCRYYRNLCFEQTRRFMHNDLGWNYRLSNLQAAVGLAQFEQLNETIARKREIGLRYTELLSSCEYLELPLSSTPYADNIYWVYGVVLKDEVEFDAIEAMKRLHAKGVETRPFFWCLHEQPVFKNLYDSNSFINSERIARRGFYIPSGPGLTDSQLIKVVESLHDIF